MSSLCGRRDLMLLFYLPISADNEARIELFPQFPKQGSTAELGRYVEVLLKDANEGYTYLSMHVMSWTRCHGVRIRWIANASFLHDTKRLCVCVYACACLCAGLMCVYFACVCILCVLVSVCLCLSLARQMTARHYKRRWLDVSRSEINATPRESMMFQPRWMSPTTGRLPQQKSSKKLCQSGLCGKHPLLLPLQIRTRTTTWCK